MIVAAAVLRNGLIFTMPPPARHHTILNHMAQAEKIDAIDVDQGFITSRGIFTDRRNAKQIAAKAGQVAEDDGDDLYSEDLW